MTPSIRQPSKASLELTRRDLDRCNELVKYLKRAQITVDGMELLAGSQVLTWAFALQRDLSIAVEKAEQADQEMIDLGLAALLPKPSIEPVEASKPDEGSVTIPKGKKPLQKAK